MWNACATTAAVLAMEPRTAKKKRGKAEKNVKECGKKEGERGSAEQLQSPRKSIRGNRPRTALETAAPVPCFRPWVGHSKFL